MNGLRLDLTIQRLNPHAADPLGKLLRVPIEVVLRPYLTRTPWRTPAMDVYNLAIPNGDAIELDLGFVGVVSLGVVDDELRVTVPRLLGAPMRAALGGDVEAVAANWKTITFAPLWQAGSSIRLPLERMGVSARVTYVGDQEAA